MTLSYYPFSKIDSCFNEKAHNQNYREERKIHFVLWELNECTLDACSTQQVVDEHCS